MHLGCTCLPLTYLHLTKVWFELNNTEPALLDMILFFKPNLANCDCVFVSLTSKFAVTSASFVAL